MAKNQRALRDLLSTNIKARREKLDISQEKLAELANTSIQTIDPDNQGNRRPQNLGKRSHVGKTSAGVGSFGVSTAGSGG